MAMNTRNPSPLRLDGLGTGFEDAVHQSQQVFRQVLTAMAEPGTIQRLPDLEAPVELHSAAYQVCLALLDQETSLWIQPSLRTQGVMGSLRFHCGCPLVEQPAAAAFALATLNMEAGLNHFSQGTHAYPDRSTTLIVQVGGLDQGGALSLTGPGIQNRRQVSIVGLDQRWLDMLAENRGQFPRGVDLIFTAGDCLMALPRTTFIERISQGGA